MRATSALGFPWGEWVKMAWVVVANWVDVAGVGMTSLRSLMSGSAWAGLWGDSRGLWWRGSGPKWVPGPDPLEEFC